MAEKRKNDLALSSLVPRGFLRTYVLSVLAKEPMHGYALIRLIEARTGFWRPSPGTMYPLLESMVNEGLVEEVPDGGRKKEYRLTTKGRKLAEDVEDLPVGIKKRVAEVLGGLMGVNAVQVEAVLNRLEKQYPDRPFQEPLQGLFVAIALLIETPEKVPQAVKILYEAADKLSDLYAGGV